ncbi:MAG TPA: hypothetical protein VGF92_15800 [Stellaceae bacterium]|jgi:hypothetical protein
MLYNPPLGGAANDPYIDGNPLTGVEGSDVPAAAIEYPQREIEAILAAAAGLVPTNADLTQTLQALKQITGCGNVTSLAATGALVASQAGVILIDATAGNVILTLPAANTQLGLRYDFIRTDATGNSVTVQRAGADNIDTGTSFGLSGQGASAGISATSATRWRTRSAVAAAQTILNGYIDGLTLSTSAASNVFGVAAGIAADHTNADYLTLAAAVTKTTGAWTAGSGNGALDTGAITNNAWYAFFIVKNPTTKATDIAISKEVAGTTPAPAMGGGSALNIAGFSEYRYIGSLMLDSGGHWVQIVQNGDEFTLVNQWASSDFSGTPTTANRTLTTMNLPLGVIVLGKFNVSTSNLQSVGVGSSYFLSDPAIADAAPVNGSTPLASIEVGISATTGGAPQVSVGMQSTCRTNTSAQIGIRGSIAQGLVVQSYGWVDTRGR